MSEFFTKAELSEMTERIDAAVVHLRLELLEISGGKDDVFFNLGVVGTVAACLFLQLKPELRAEILEKFIATLRSSIRTGAAAKPKR